VPNISPQELIAQDLQTVEAYIRSTGEGAGQPLAGMIQSVFQAGGKRIRPTITLLMGHLLHAPMEPLIQLAAAIELTHTATLIHDDLLDNAEMRRGQSALHQRHSHAIAVLTGDYLFAQAAVLEAAHKNPRTMERFSGMLSTIVRGEMEQLVHRGTLPTMAEYEQRIFAKTAAMFETACACSALLADASAETLAAAEQYGRQAGMAFQIVDDVLDFFGETGGSGKPDQRDLFQGVFTLPVLLYQQKNPEDTDLISIRAGQSDEATLRRLSHSIQIGGFLQDALAKAEEYSDSAAQSLADFPINTYRSALEQLTREIVARKV
jgi:geranylgeranyl pyrophosphate synthase